MLQLADSCAWLAPSLAPSLCLCNTHCRRILRYLYGEHLRRCWLLSDVKPKFFDALLGVARLETFMPQVGGRGVGVGG